MGSVNPFGNPTSCHEARGVRLGVRFEPINPLVGRRVEKAH